MRNLSESRRLTVALLILLILVVVASRRGDMQGACDGAFVALNVPAELSVDTLAAVDGYLASVYGADDKPHVLAFYSDYSDIQAMLGNMVNASFADYSGFALRRIRWNAATCRYDDASPTRARVAFASTRFTGATLFGLVVHETSHLYGSPDSTEAHGASWWERLGNHAWNGTCGQVDWDAQEHCMALQAVLGG